MYTALWERQRKFDIGFCPGATVSRVKIVDRLGGSVGGIACRGVDIEDESTGGW